MGLYDKFIVLDLETSGLNNDRDDVLEIYAGCYDQQGRLLDEMHYYIDNGIEISQEITDINGITNELIKEKGKEPLKVCQAWKQFPFNNKCQALVGHNLFLFDYMFLCNYIQRKNKVDKWKYPSFHTMKDTMILSSEMRKQNDKGYRGWMKLQVMCQWLGVEFKEDSAHSARYDVGKTAECFIKLLRK